MAYVNMEKLGQMLEELRDRPKTNEVIPTACSVCHMVKNMNTGEWLPTPDDYDVHDYSHGYCPKCLPAWLGNSKDMVSFK